MCLQGTGREGMNRGAQKGKKEVPDAWSWSSSQLEAGN